MAYIYQITNDINGKIYVGKTEFSLEKRFKEHCKDAFKERNEQRPLYAAMRKYGIEHFHIKLLEETDTPEEREIFWIEQLGTFKKGYNATQGGDGRKYIDYDLVVANYQKLQNQVAVAGLMNISVDSVKDILKCRQIPIKTSNEILREQTGKMVYMLDKDSNQLLQTFTTSRDAARWLIENGYTNCKLTTARQHISEVCRGLRKTASGFKWQFATIE